jgi:hypothetical protein
MDWNKLQHTLFEMDPSDPREDLAKLTAQAQGGNSAPAAETVDYLQESAEVAEGSLQMDRDYSVTDFAALAGVRIDEKQKHGDYARGSDPMPKAEPGRTKHPLKDKLVGEDEVDEGFKDAWKAGWDNYNKLGAVKSGYDAMASDVKSTATKKSSTGSKSSTNKSSDMPSSVKQLSKGDSFKDRDGMVWYYNPNEGNWRSKDRKKTISPEKGFKLWKLSPSSRTRKTKEDQIEALESRVAYLESVIETLLEGKTPKKPAMPNPVAKHMNTYNKASVVPDKKKDAKAGKQKHKGQQYESIADELWAKLNEFGKS